MYRTHLAMHILAGQRVRYFTLSCCKGDTPLGMDLRVLVSFCLLVPREKDCIWQAEVY